MKRYYFLILSIALSQVFSSCRKDEKGIQFSPSETAGAQILAMGFDTTGMEKTATGYLVEGDINLSLADLASKFANSTKLVVGNTEQYHTTNLVTGWPRNITISTGSLASYYVSAMDIAIARYNSLQMGLTFTRIGTPGNISLSAADLGTQSNSPTATSGPPSAAGAPYPSILLNVNYMNGNTNINYMASVIQHELGHCIGMRHTDYMDNSFSCGGSYKPESDPNGVGAVHIPGTPTTGDAQSLMLACNTGLDRSFITDDIIAFTYLYNASHDPGAQPVYEFYSSSRQDHAFSINANYPLFYPSQGWSLVGSSYKAYLNSSTGGIPIYEYRNDVQGDHAFSPNNNDPNILNQPNWYLNGTTAAFYCFSTQVSGTIPVYWYYSSSMTCHVYTSDGNLNNEYPGFGSRSLAWYAPH